MDVGEYFESEEEQLEKRAGAVTNPRVFDFDFMPPNPLMREEAKKIINAVLRYQTTGVANNLMVFGARGCGKTLMVRFITEELLAKRHKGTRVFYANCRHHNTTSKILAKLHRCSPKSYTPGELWERLLASIQDRAVFVIDEADLWSDREKNRDLLYFISRASPTLNAIVLTNNTSFQLDASTQSSLQPEVIYFKDYDALQMREILLQRARQGLRKTRQDAIGRIAALTTQHTNSDVRVALKTLYYTAIHPKESTENLFNEARRDLVSDILVNLNQQLLIILQAAAVVQNGEEPFSANVYRKYKDLCKGEHVDPTSYRYFQINLTYLQNLGLIVLSRAKLGRTYTKAVELLFEPKLAKLVHESRFGM